MQKSTGKIITIGKRNAKTMVTRINRRKVKTALRQLTTK